MLLGVSASWGLMGTRMAVSFLVMPLFYHYLPKELLGVWLLFASLGAVFAVSDLGMATVTARALAWHQGKRSGQPAPVSLPSGLLDHRPEDLVATVSRAYLGLGLSVLVLAGSFGFLYLGTLNLDLEALAEARGAWCIYALGLAFVLAGSTPNYVLQGLGDVGLEAVGQTGALWIGLLAQWRWLVAGGSLSGLAIIFFLQAVGTRAVLWAVLRRRHPWLFQRRGHFRKALLRSLLGQSSGLFISSLCSLFIYQVNPVLIVSLLGSAALPDYSALIVLASMGMQLASAVPQALMPFAAQRSATGDAEGLRRLHRLSLKVSMGLQVTYTAVLLYGAPTWLSLWLGPGHFVGYPVLGLLCLFYLLEHQHVANATFAFSSGRWPFAPWSFAGGLLNTIFVYLGLKRFGLVGAAGGSVLAQLLTNNWYVVWYTLRRLGVGLVDYVNRVLAPLAGTALLLAALALGWRAWVGPWMALPGSWRSVPWAEAAPVLLGAVLLGLTAAVGTWYGSLEADERALFMVRLGRLLPGKQGT